jgi:hypothetical protein
VFEPEEVEMLRVIFEDVQIEVATGTYVLAGSTFA